ncbi:hypothetical protein EDB81DRAFT_760017 [Dactylonectria macrodidyma]|uniref:Uncharacterized protein n=1 Tax=Dactylonectria macrodidyma TaxID=307937 RepID=A0A9P9ETD1_9HYPO|nr:hypothetical protein EDB81DRAFT_760017 [Dactylonectria macrodidyma]
MYDAIGKAENSVQNDIGTMVKTFAPDIDDTAEFNLLMDVIDSQLTNNAMKVIKSSSNNIGFEDLKDLVVNGASWGATVAKDFQNNKRETDGTLVEAQVGNIATNLKQTVVELKMIFLGTDRSVEFVGRMISGGGLVNIADSDEFEDLQKLIRQVSAAGAPVFLADSGYSCDAVGPLDKKYITSETAEKTEFCYQKRLYYLLAPKGPPENCQIPDGIGPQLPVCVDMFFSAPDGLESFNETNSWADLTIDDLVAGAVEGWRANKGRYTGKFIDMTEKGNYEYLLNGDRFVVNVRAPGVVQIPVCSPQQARAGWLAAYEMTPEKRAQFLANLPSWPCPIQS